MSWMGMTECDGFGYGFGDDGVDRSQWREKSNAALGRERRAKERFTQFLEECKGLEDSAFPVTKDVVPPQVHLTDACWKTFKQFCIQHGCTIKRRVATPQERLESKEKRKSNVYVVSVTAPVHPSKAEERMLLKKKKAEEAAEKKRLKLERDAQAAKDLKEQTEKAYQAIVDSLTDDKKTEDNVPPAVLKPQDANHASPDEGKPSPTKKTKTNHPPTALSKSLLAHAESVHHKRLHSIAHSIYRERLNEEQVLMDQLRDKMQQKKKEREEEAEVQLAKIKSAILATDS